MASVVTANMGLIHHYAKRMAPPGMYDEMVQETVLCILDTTTFDHRDDASGWIRWRARAARHRLIRAHFKHHPEGKPVDGEPTTLAGQEQSAELAMVRGRMVGLPTAQREAVELTLSGLDIGEVGAALGVSRQAAHQRLQRARDALGIAA